MFTIFPLSAQRINGPLRSAQKNVAGHQRQSACAWRCIAENNEHIARFVAQQLPRFFRNDDLSALTDLHRAEKVFVLWRHADSCRFLIKMHQIVQRHIVEHRQRITIDQIRHALASFPLRDCLSRHTDALSDLLQRQPLLLAQRRKIVRKMIFLFVRIIHLFHTSCIYSTQACAHFQPTSANAFCSFWLLRFFATHFRENPLTLTQRHGIC